MCLGSNVLLVSEMLLLKPAIQRTHTKVISAFFDLIKANVSIIPIFIKIIFNAFNLEVRKCD